VPDAIDVDAFDMGTGNRRVREILKVCGWTQITNSLPGAECWH
jgi:hypothetical protein